MFNKAIQKFTEATSQSTFELKAVFFDMDGVLFDSMKYHASSWKKAMNDVGIQFSEYEGYMNEGRTGHSTINGAFMREHGREATDEEKQTIYRLKSGYFEACGKSPVMPFAKELLAKVNSQNVGIYLVTGSGQLSLLDSLQEHFPSIFVKERMVTAYDVTQGKPHPEPYLQALKKSRLDINQVVVIENAPLGVQSAKAAGLFVIAVNTGPLDEKVLWESGADVVFGSIQELYEKWDELTSGKK